MTEPTPTHQIRLNEANSFAISHSTKTKFLKTFLDWLDYEGIIVIDLSLVFILSTYTFNCIQNFYFINKIFN